MSTLAVVWRIHRRLYLGDYQSGYEALQGVELATEPDGELSPFSGVVSLCPMPLMPQHEIRGPARDETEWLQVPIFDGGYGEDEFEAALEVALPFIRRRREAGNVLVHCAAGMSRSVSVLAAFLCEDHDATPEGALDEIASAKAKCFDGVDCDPDLLIAPAWEFRSALGRRYGSGPNGSGHR